VKISARVENSRGNHQVTLHTGEKAHSIDIPPKSNGPGSSANGGELLFLALATCYCNDLYREAAKRGMHVESVEVQVDGDFSTDGAPATNVSYRAKVKADAIEEEIRELMTATDCLTEIQNTLRVGTPVTLSQIEVERV
jgi:organic hydroperoxide reductase OsmC/OhrA